MTTLLSVLLKAENALASSLPQPFNKDALQAHWEAWQAVQEQIRAISR